MRRRTVITHLLAVAACPSLLLRATTARAEESVVNVDLTETIKPLAKAHAQWKGVVSDASYRVLFEEATERPGSSPLDKNYADGTYICAACHLPLFDSSHKFDSGTGWPSFFTHIPGHIKTKRDFKLIWPRTEYHCARCGGHQGHLFDDGPQPTGQRFCNNGVALAFVARADALPALRS
ncbi:MAG: peptide-methionine (R)-S-oxide reductase MsrB [Pseudomarimonas sp.]